MNRFIEEFETLLQEFQCGSGSKVFEIAGLEPAILSRIRNQGFQIQFADLKPLAAAMGGHEMIYLRLLRARLLDECTDPLAARIEIEISGAKPARQELREASYLPQLPKKLETAMVEIAHALPHEAELRKTISYLGRSVAKLRPPVPASVKTTPLAEKFAGAKSAGKTELPPAPHKTKPK